ncbi:hypothetical protein G8A07_08425 [Roseateles sp. DAIF2]|uniref:hypothetical protein n=1 Tax=Roseateles sp. DAIF2 TaxID=2714952 RepID=UPI0018A2C75E|nr:hypothetical protein [Roseateles sp. DAIF2]QPF72951.1 hypothetical protein G8A07_08425 [Roseateles sp. DAIF2]
MKNSAPARRQGLLLALVLLAHALLLFGLFAQRQTPRRPDPATTTRVTIPLRLIAARPAPPPARITPPTRQAPAAAVRTARPAPAPAPASAPVEQTAAITPAQPASAAASGPTQPLLLDSEATRRAIRQAAREAAPLTAAPPGETEQQRLARRIDQSGHGDCLKGEFIGGGMGLLSAPFWLLAEARGKCKR